MYIVEERGGVWLLGRLSLICYFFAQFPDIVEFCEEMANAGKTVIVAALDGTFQRKVTYPTYNMYCNIRH